ncbi:MAG: DUF1990 family protein [Actinomycetota bacterium]
MPVVKNRNRKRSTAPPQTGEPVQVATEGSGPLWQRDYTGVILDTPYAPEEVLKLLLRDFPRFSPDVGAKFHRLGDPKKPLEVDEEMTIDLRGYGKCVVRVVKIDDRSITLRTLEGHLEAGRISFGAFHDDRSRLVFRIRSRARIGGPLRYLGYRLIGMPIQTAIWVEFVKRVAAAVGGRLEGEVKVESRKVQELPSDRGEQDAATFSTRDELPKAA